jgi:glutathionyl-hydroquinone reductase
MRSTILPGEHTDYYPASFRSEIDTINKRVYESFNNGVYRCGFATKQQVYEQAVAELFDTLDWLEARFGTNRYLLGGTITAQSVVLDPRALSDARHRRHLRH